MASSGTSPACSPPHGGNLQAEVTHADHRVVVTRPDEILGLSFEDLGERIEKFFALETCPVTEERHGGKTKTKDYRALTHSLNLAVESGGRIIFEGRLACGGGCAAVARQGRGSIGSPDCRPVADLIGLGAAVYGGAS